MNNKLPRDFYAQDTLQVARALLGQHLVHLQDGTRRVGRIVETEAYLGPEDLAAHSARGRTPRNAIMFGTPGYAYVYLIYGMWHCMNVVTREAGVPQAVLIRALEPVDNLHQATHGPGLLCRAMHIDRRLDKANLLAAPLWIEAADAPDLETIVSATRIGVDYAGDWALQPWRFYLRDSAYVSTLTSAQRKGLAAKHKELSESV